MPDQSPPNPVPTPSPASNTGTSGDAPKRGSRRWFANHITGRGLRRRTRWALRIFIGVPLLLVLAVIILIRSPLVGRMVKAQIEKAAGCHFEAASAAINFDGRLALEKVRLTIPGMDGPEAEFLKARHADVDLDWSGLLSGSVRPTALRLFEPVFRVSLGDTDGRLNLDSLATPPSGSEAIRPPKINAIAGRVEFGEHSTTSEAYTALKSIFVDGDLIPAENGAPEYQIKLQELVRVPGASPGGAGTERGAAGGGGSGGGGVERRHGMFLEGRVDLAKDDAELNLHNVGLDEWPPSSVPRKYRQMWQELDVQGNVKLTAFRYSKAAGLSANVAVESVAMNIPVPAERPELADGKPLALVGVNGDIGFSNSGLTARLSGRIGDLPCNVMLQTFGSDLNSALRCEITSERFKVEQNPRLLPYAPEVVRRHLATFSGPTALVDARAVVERAPPIPNPAGGPATPGAVSINGSIAFQNGTARFHAFPYPVNDLRGLVTFTDQKVEILNIKGRGPTGAIVSASGIIEPPDEDAAVHIEVLALDLPLDDVLESTLDADQRQVLSALVNREGYNRLVERGLVVPPGQRAAVLTRLREAEDARRAAAASPDTDARVIADLDARIADLRRRAAAPAFEFGGLANLTIVAQSERGRGKPFTYTVDIDFPKVGMVPGSFPFPIDATNVRVHLDGDELHLTRGTFSGLRGGTADMKARVVLKNSRNPEFQPFVHIRAEAIPVDDLLVNAVPDDEPPPVSADAPPLGPGSAPPGNESGLRFSTKALLRSLHLDGTVGCTADLAPGKANRTSIAAQVRLSNVSASPRATETAAGPGVSIRDLSGVIQITDRAITIDQMAGSLLRLADPDAQPQDAGSVSLRLQAAFSDTPEPEPSPVEPASPLARTPSSLSALVSATDLDLTAPFEDLIRLFSPRGAAKISLVRAQRGPAGRINAQVALEQQGSADPAITLTADNARDLSFNALDGRIALDHRRGTIRVEPVEPARIRFDDFDAAVRFNGEPALDATLDGSVRVATEGSPEPLPSEDRLRASLREGRFEAPLTRAVLAAALSPKALAGVQAMDPRGAFDAELVLAAAAPPAAVGGGAGSPPSRYDLSGAISPRSISVVRGGSRHDFPSVSGRATFDSRTGGGGFESLAAAGPRWSAMLNGDWSAIPGGGLSLDTDLTASAPALTPEIRAALPGSLQRLLDRLKVDITGPLTLRNAHITTTIPPDDAPDNFPSPALGFRGELAFAGASADIGIGVSQCDGSYEISLHREPAAENVTFDSTLRADAMTAAGLPLTGLTARIVSGASPGQVVVPRCDADFFGGRFTATAVARTEASPDNPDRSYRVDLLIAGSRFAPVLDALAERASTAAPGDPLDETRGRLDASFSLFGIPGDPSSRHGRGSMRVAGGDVLRLPLIFQLMELSNLQLPSDDRLDYMQAAFDLKGTQLEFDRIAIMSEGLSILGAGTIRWPDLELDMRFNTQTASSRRVPIWSDLFETVRNELITTVVSGTVRDPRFATASLSGTVKMLSGLLDPEGKRSGETPDDTERAARLERQRLRDASREGQAPAIALPPSTRAGARAGALP